jgi:predicted Zn-dependent protease/Flp pilus assembly protein TadD
MIHRLGLRLFAFALGCLQIVSVCVLSANVQAQNMERSLDAVELNVLGKKYSRLPTERRLAQLERQLDTAPPVHQSVKYRMSRVLDAQQEAVPSEERQAAVRLYNRSVDAAARGDTAAAMQDCREAIKLNHYLIPAYNNLANLQEKTRQYDAAAATYQQVIAIAPNEPLLHFNLAVILEKIGKIPEAFDAYRRYVELSDAPDLQIVSLVASYDAKRRQGGNETDYLFLATKDSQGTRLVWPTWQVPIPVYVALTEPSQAAFMENVHQAFDRWSQATGGRLRFREVGVPEQARIYIALQPGPLMAPGASIGHASFNMMTLNSDDPMRELKVNIAVNTGELHSDIPLPHRQEQVSKLLLHELGHSVGLWGHSNDPGDIMYTHPIVSTLSSRDLKTIRRLYDLNVNQ